MKLYILEKITNEWNFPCKLFKREVDAIRSATEDVKEVFRTQFGDFKPPHVIYQKHCSTTVFHLGVDDTCFYYWAVSEIEIADFNPQKRYYALQRYGYGYDKGPVDLDTWELPVIYENRLQEAYAVISTEFKDIILKTDGDIGWYPFLFFEEGYRACAGTNGNGLDTYKWDAMECTIVL